MPVVPQLLGMNSSICRCGGALVQVKGCDGVGIGSPFFFFALLALCVEVLSENCGYSGLD